MSEIKVPELAESITEASIAEWLVQPGDVVTSGHQVAAIETDKVMLEVFAAADGTIGELLKQVGDDVTSGEVLTTLDESAASAKPAAAKQEKVESKSTAKASGETIEIKVPELAESISEASLNQWLKNVGDSVAVDEVVATIETDKVTLEIPALKSGVITEQLATEGDDVTSGQLIGKLVAGDEVQAVAQPAVAQPTKASASTSSGPAARKLAAEANLDLAKVDGSGHGGRVTKQDVVQASAAGAKPQPVSSTAVQSGSDRVVRREKMSKLRSVIAKRLLTSQQESAILTTFNEVDMTEVIDLRKQYREAFEAKHGVKLGFMSFFVKAVCAALVEYPIINASIEGNEIVYHDYCDVGIAVGTKQGLVVPILRDADLMSMAQIEQTIADYSARAQTGKLQLEELIGGTFTITNGGVFGSMLSTPILNPPQSAILGVHATKQRPCAVNGKVVVKPMNYFAVSYDHQIIDGRDAILFLVAVKNALEEPARLLLEI